MSNVHLRMLSYKVHLLVESLDACHIGLCIVCKLDLLAAAYTFCSPVEISHIDRTSHFTGDCMEAGLPTLYRLACSFRSEGEVHDFLSLHFLDHAQSNVTSSLSVNWNSTELPEKPAKRADKQFSLDHAVWLTTYRFIIEIRNDEVPERSVRNSKNNAFVFWGYRIDCCPSQSAE